MKCTFCHDKETSTRRLGAWICKTCAEQIKEVTHIDYTVIVKLLKDLQSQNDLAFDFMTNEVGIMQLKNQVRKHDIVQAMAAIRGMFRTALQLEKRQGGNRYGKN